MDQAKKNKEFIMDYGNAMSSDVPKTRELLERYISDQSLIEHILFFEAVFPRYEVLIDEMTAEGNRVILRGRLKGKHLGEFNGIPATQREVILPMVVGYEIENRRIVSHWLIADQMLLMEQLGLTSQPAEVKV